MTLTRLAAAAALGVALLLGGGFAWFLDRAAAPPDTPLAPAAGIAVLTGGAHRIETALALLQADRAARLLVSGAHPQVALADLARLGGIAEAALAGRVALGHTAATTRGNALEIAAWARREGLGSIRIVTAGYHMPRALLELRRALPGVALIPHPVLPPQLAGAEAATRLRSWTLLVGEYAKLLGTWAGLGPAA